MRVRGSNASAPNLGQASEIFPFDIVYEQRHLRVFEEFVQKSVKKKISKTGNDATRLRNVDYDCRKMVQDVKKINEPVITSPDLLKFGSGGRPC